MTRSDGDGDGRFGEPAAHDVRLTLEVSLSPDVVRGRVLAEGSAATPFDGWLGLARAVVAAARAASDGAIVAGPPLLGVPEPSSGPDARAERPGRDRKAG